MKHPKLHLPPELWQMPLAFALSVSGGFVLSAGTVSGVASPLAAALAGVTPPLYSVSILLGALLCYGVNGAPAGMHFLLTMLTLVTCVRVLFRELTRPHVQAFVAAVCGILGGFTLHFVLEARTGSLPLYIFESFLTAAAAYVLADARDSLRENRRIVLSAGKTFTFAVCYLLCVTALCGLDTPFCNIGRIAGTVITLLFARQMRHTGGTLLGALTACGVTLCSVSLGTPVLFLPVTGMLAGFLANLPNALFIPVFFVMQGLSSAVLDSSRELYKILAELAVSCGIYALFAHFDLYRFVMNEQESTHGFHVHHERYLEGAVRGLREESTEVMRRLSILPPEDAVAEVRAALCTGCKNRSYCWVQRSSQTAAAIRELIHTHRRGIVPEALDGCIRRTSLLEHCAEGATRQALAQMQRVRIMQDRQLMLEHLQILEDVTGSIAARKEPRELRPQTDALRRILHQCACSAESAQVWRLRTGRIAAEVYTEEADFPAANVRTLFEKYLRIGLGSVTLETEKGFRICYYQTPPYELEFAVHSINAPDYERCGDHSDAFTDATGDQYLVLADGMGSGSSASLASRIAVRTFRRLVESGMRVETAIRLLNSMLMTETGTEHFTTLDVLQFHADCGELSLYKSGAAATLLCRGGTVQRISSMSFPVGIVTDALPSRKRTTAHAGDAVVMLSDGIGEAEYPYISQLLREGQEPARIVQEAVEKCAVFQGGTSRDDVTVIAARVTSRFHTDVTKNVNLDGQFCVKNVPIPL